LSGELQNKLMRAIGQTEATARLVRPLKKPFRVSYGTPWPHMPDRLDFGLFLNRLGLLGCGAEIGVKQGGFSEVVLDHWRGRHLISIDPWQTAPSEEYVDRANVEQDEHDRYYGETRQRLQRFGSRSSIWRMTGDDGAERIPHHSLDFVYIDARHDYEAVMQDLRTWSEKIRPGGVIAGHDYVDGLLWDSDFGVKTAVQEFFASRRVRINATFADPPWFSWFIILPRH
jgi:hypothetical protein